MNAAAFDVLSLEQKRRVWEIWKDPTLPDQFLYVLEGDEITGRVDKTKVTGRLQYDEPQLPPAPPLQPDTVTSSRVDPKPITTRDVLHELPPAMRPPVQGSRGAHVRSVQRVGRMAPESAGGQSLSASYASLAGAHTPRPAASKPKPTRRRKARPFFTRADFARGLLVLVAIAYALISAH